MKTASNVILRFDRTDTATVRLLRDLGFSRREIRDGRLTETEFQRRDLNPEALLSLARLDNSYEAERFRPRESRLSSGTTHLLPRESQKGRKILKKTGLARFRELTSVKSCWRGDLVRLFRDQILKDKRVIQRFDKPLRDPALAHVSRCPSHTLPFDFEERIFFPLDLYDDPNAEVIQSAANSVWTIADGPEEKDRSGSAVRIGPALYVTANHQLLDESCEERIDDLHLRFGAAALNMEPLPAPRGEDVRLLRVTEVPGTFLPIAQELPKVGDIVYSVGYPNLKDGQEKRRLLSVGTVVSVSGNRIEHTALTFKGSSGGALLNARGELIGINTQGRPRDSKGREFGPGDLSRWHYTGGVAESVVPMREAILQLNGSRR